MSLWLLLFMPITVLNGSTNWFQNWLKYGSDNGTWHKSCLGKEKCMKRELWKPPISGIIIYVYLILLKVNRIFSLIKYKRSIKCTALTIRYNALPLLLSIKSIYKLLNLCLSVMLLSFEVLKVLQYAALVNLFPLHNLLVHVRFVHNQVVMFVVWI